MYGLELSNFSFWWIIPIVMMILCFFMMRGRRRSMMCGFGSRGIRGHQNGVPEDSALDIIDKRYASGEISKEEYEEIKRTISESTDFTNG